MYRYLCWNTETTWSYKEHYRDISRRGKLYILHFHALRSNSTAMFRTDSDTESAAIALD